MIGFDEQDIGFTQAVQHKFGHLPEIGQYANIDSFCSHQKTYRVLRVMQHIEGFNGKVAEFETVPGGEQPALDFSSQLKLDCFLRGPIAINRNAQLFTQASQALDVVGMFMGDKDRGQGFRGASNRREALANLAQTEARINQNPHLVRLDVRAIAR